MSLILRKWIKDQAINNSKIDPTDTYTITGLRVDGTNAVGKIGIGINDPQDALHIRRTDSSAGLILDLDDGVSGRSYHLYSDQSGYFNIKDGDLGLDRFTLTSTPSVVRVGIDTTSPQDTLHVRTTLLPSTLRLDTDDGFSGRAYRLVSDTDGAFKIIDVDAGSVNRLQIADTGTLTVSGDATFDSNFQINGTVTVINTEVIVADQLEINQTDNQAALIVSQDTPGTTATVMRIENAGNGYALTVDSGNVGIGTLTPAAPLHVQGDIITANGANIGNTTHRIGTLWMASAVDYLTNLNFNSSGTYVTFTTGGRVGIGSTLPTQALDVVGNIVGSVNITAGTGVTATTGNINATVGNIVATLGSVSAGTFMNAGTTITAGTGITATTGNIIATAGNVIAGAQIQGATLNITTGPNTIIGATTNTGTFTVQNATDVSCRVVRTGGGGGSAVFGVSNGPPSFWATGAATGDSLIQSSAGHTFHIGSASLSVPTISVTSTGATGLGKINPSYALHIGGNDAGGIPVIDKIGIGNGNVASGGPGAGWGIFFLHRSTTGTAFQSRIASVIGTTNNKSDIVLSPSAPASIAIETVRISRTAIDSYLDLKAFSTGNSYITTYNGLSPDFRIKTIYSGVSNPDKIVEMGAINGGQTHITYGAGTRGISILSNALTPGFVGIGTATPTQKLHVQGNAIITGNLNVGSFTVSSLNISGPTNVQLSLTRTGGGNGSIIYAVTNGPGEYGWATPAAGNSIIQYASGKNLYIGRAGTADPFVVFTAGSVGIGTFAPGATLHVEGNIFTANNADIGDASHRVSTIYMASTIDYSANLNFNSGSTKVTFTTTGNVGIGTTNPTAKLHLVGNGVFNGIITITSDLKVVGNVGIGSSIPSVKLDVIGTGKFDIVQVGLNLLVGGRVGIGTTNPNYPLEVIGGAKISNLIVSGNVGIQTAALASDGIKIQTSGSGSNYHGVRAIIDVTGTSSSKAIYASNWGAGGGIDARSGAGDAIYAESSSGNAGHFVSPNGHAGLFESSAGSTLSSVATGTGSNHYALYAACASASASNSSIALYVQNIGAGRGIRVTSTTERAIHASCSGGGTSAIYGYNSSTTGNAISGECIHLNAYAGYFENTIGISLKSIATGTVSTCRGLQGECTSASAHVLSVAVRAHNAGAGIGLKASSVNGYSIRASTTSASNNAVYINGNIEINGNFTCNGVKSFRINHPFDPDNKYLNHSSVESPEVRTAYYGQATVIDGIAIINLPEWWMALNGKDKTEYNYLLTPIGRKCVLYVSKEIENNQFEISSDDGDCKFSWLVSAIRHDKVMEENRMRVEVEKTSADKESERQDSLEELERLNSVTN